MKNIIRYLNGIIIGMFTMSCIKEFSWQNICVLILFLILALNDIKHIFNPINK